LVELSLSPPGEEGRRGEGLKEARVRCSAVCWQRKRGKEGNYEGRGLIRKMGKKAKSIP
jgi:hypothetical protein